MVKRGRFFYNSKYDFEKVRQILNESNDSIYRLRRTGHISYQIKDRILKSHENIICVRGILDCDNPFIPKQTPGATSPNPRG